MSITRLQQARQMYAMGQRVAKTLDGSRPGYRGSDYGDEARGTGGYSGSGDTGDFGSEKANVANTKSAETNLGMDSRDRAISNQYKNMPTPTVTVGVDKFDNPINIKTTYTDRRAREQMLGALNAKGISSFDPRVTKKGFNFLDPNNLMTNFAPKQKQFGLLDLALIAASGGLLGPKIAAGAKMYNTGKFAYDKAKQLASLAEAIGLTDKNVVDSFTNSFTDNKSTTKSNTKNNTTTNNGGDGDGIASLENQASGYDEYILLLQKLQSGNISDSERNRYNVLKNMLGI
jgi:hypothetical protein